VAEETLGRLEKVELRAYWEREDTHFTPWMAREENIGLLGDTIGIELEVQEEEASVGPFRADILCRNTSDNTLVLIENQLERTDHSHLGQLITYAAGLDAVTLVWIVQRFTEEHRAAIDWLNRITDDSLHFFGLEIELWRIGESVAAPKFNLVAKPNDWARTVRDAASVQRGPLTEGQQLQVDYWADFGAYLDAEGVGLKAPKPYPSGWVGFGVGRSDAWLMAVLGIRDGWISVRLSLHGGHHPTWYPTLLEQRAEIEQELGFELHWQENPDAKFSNIDVRIDADVSDRDGWTKCHQWLASHVTAFERVFRPRLREL
jgi:hypothetical protein